MKITIIAFGNEIFILLLCEAYGRVNLLRKSNAQMILGNLHITNQARAPAHIY